tara:strand:- start:25804 stop:26214 length:411 start_codon:yes stop_codon:yes gene_type:complete
MLKTWLKGTIQIKVRSMAHYVKLADEIIAEIRRESKLHGRSVAGQLAHWVRIGRTMERSKAFDCKRIRDVLEGTLSPDALAPVEQYVWFDQFTANMIAPGEQEKAFYAKRRKLGRGVGMSKSGELVYETNVADDAG